MMKHKIPQLNKAMTKLTFSFFAVASLFLSNLAMAEKHDGYKGFDIKVSDLGQGIYELRTDRSGNVAVLIGDDGVFMVDTQMEHLVDLIDSAQKKLSNNREVNLVLNTHLHRDHVMGNAYFKSKGATIMAHPNVRKYLVSPRAIKALGREAPLVSKEYLPTVNITDETTITMNNQNIQLFHTPRAHTDGDLFVYFKDANVIHAGDLLFAGRFPFIDIDNGGTVAGFIAGVEKILAVADENTKIIAGHGPTSTISDLQASIKMLNETHEIINKLVQQKLSLAEITQMQPLAKYHDKWNWAFITTDRMVQTHYYDITGKLE